MLVRHFVLSITLGILMLTVEGILNNISGLIIILFSFAAMVNPSELYKKKAVSPVLIVAFFLSWLAVINFGTYFFIVSLMKVESLNGFTAENIRILFLGVVFIALLILSDYLFIYRLFETAGVIGKVNRKLEEKDTIDTFGPGNDG
jgi:hypothetical protein